MSKWRALLVRRKLVGSDLVLSAFLGDAFDLGTGATLDPYLIFGCFVLSHLLIIARPTLTWALLLPCLSLVYSVALSFPLFYLPPVPSLGVIRRDRSV